MVKTAVAERFARFLRNRPDALDTAIEVGLIDRRWVDDPGQYPLSNATTLEVVQRFLERSSEQHPSAVAEMGLNAIQLLSWNRAGDKAEGAPVATAVAFTDLEGFTRYTAREGDDAALALLAAHHRTVGPIVRGRGGRIVKRLGDGLMLAFPSPESAVLAALELVPTAPDPLRLRAGVHWGEAALTRDDLIGHVVNVAARVTQSAKGGQVLVTEPVVTEAGPVPGVRFSSLRRRSFKGVGEAVLVARAEWG